MAFRPYENLIAGELDNTVPGKVTGWLDFYRHARAPLRVTLDLAGDCHRDLRGRRFRVTNPEPRERFPDERRSSVDRLDPLQQGETGDMTAGDPPQDYVDYPYLEWYSEANGRVVLELERSQLEILTEPAFPVAGTLDRSVQRQHLAGFLQDLASSTGAIAAVVEPPPKRRKRKTASRD